MDGNFLTVNKIAKVDSSLGLVLGWGIISTIKGQPYYDLQGDHIPDDVMLKAAADFMSHGRVAMEMHGRTGNQAPIGHIVFAMPLTDEIAKAYGIQCDQTGLMIAMRPTADVLAKFKSGEFTGFSLGGNITEFELTEEEDD